MDAISNSGASDFKLGDWWVRPQRNELEREGETGHVESRSMQVLVCLGRHAPSVVSKERLLEEVWTDSPYVGDDVISHAVWELRKALGDSARDSVYIQTVPRKGYRLVAEILRPQGSPMPMEGVRIDHYDLLEELGRGSMGVVYEAVDRRLDRNVAIKFLAPELTRDPKACQRFEREARLAASLDHPNLATVHEVGETSEGHRYLVNAYYRGGSLKDRLAEGPIEVEESLRLIRQLVAGLGAAHQRDIVHRDVKPANLLLDEHGTLKICDFGIAKLLGATDLTRTGTPLGTPAYKSPEQTQGRAVDHRTDLWSVGVVFFELITGRRPFDGDYEHAIAHSILSREPRTMEDARGRPVPEPLRRFIARALAKEPAERYQSAEEMAVALDRLGEAGLSPPHAVGSRRWIGVAAAVLAMVLILVGQSYWRQASEDLVDSREGRDYLDLGRTLWLRGNHPANLRQVREHFEKAVALVPFSAEALGHLAAFLAVESYNATDKNPADHDRARELVLRALAVDDQCALAYAAEAMILLIEGEIEEGERRVRQALEIEPECDRGGSCDLAYLWLAEARWIQGDVAGVFEALDKGIQEGGGNIRCRLKRAQLFEWSGKEREAEDDYRAVLGLDNMQTTALQELANFYLKSRRAGDAMPLLLSLYQQTQDPDVLISTGYARYLRGFWEEAIGDYRKAHLAYQATGALVPTPLTAIGDIYLEQGKQVKAREQYGQALEIFNALRRPSINRQAQRAVCLAKLGEFDDAEKEIQRLLKHEDVTNLLFYAARIYALKGDRETLLSLARRWAELGGPPSRFLDDDPAFIPYRDDREYLQIVEPLLTSTVE